MRNILAREVLAKKIYAHKLDLRNPQFWESRMFFATFMSCIICLRDINFHNLSHCRKSCWRLRPTCLISKWARFLPLVQFHKTAQKVCFTESEALAIFIKKTQKANIFHSNLNSIFPCSQTSLKHYLATLITGIFYLNVPKRFFNTFSL